jgi:hypothetical protein
MARETVSARGSSEKTTATPQSLAQCEQLLRRVKARYPLLTLGQDSAVEYLRLFAKLEREVGWERLEQGVEAALATCRFFPNEAEIRPCIPALTAKRIVVDERCPDCGGTGWKPIDPTKRMSAVVRCDCRKVV